MKKMNTTIDSLYEEASTLHASGKITEAIERLEHIIQRSPDSKAALRLLGVIFAQKGEMDKASHYLKLNTELEPFDASLHNNLANAYKILRKFPKALFHYQEALKYQPDYPEAHNNLATLYASQNQYLQALQHYRFALHSRPDFIDAHFNLGLLLLKHNEPNAAKKQFNNVITLVPNHVQATFYLGVLALEANALKEAEEKFFDVLKQDPEHVQALTNLGVIALKNEQGQVAIDYFTKALSLDNDFEEARNNLAGTFIHHDRFENALVHYEILLKKNPKCVEYLYNSGVAQMALGQLQKSIELFENILRSEPDHFATLNNLAAVFVKLHDRAKAIELLNRALKVNPHDEATQFIYDAYTGTNKQSPASADYARHLFDNYALYYDQHLQGPLNYTLPHHIGQLLHRLQINHVKKTIDLGAGTGLCGIVLREISDYLVGVDISKKMLSLAGSKGIYDELLESELITHLKQQRHYDMAVAADVLPYLGELNTLFSLLHERLSTNGLFIFSHEISEHEPWELQTSARFCHHPDYIKKLCDEYQFKMIDTQKVVARHQDNQALPMMLCFAVRVYTHST